MCYNILERKNAFLAQKKQSLKSRKIEIFPKGLTHGFGQKTAIFEKIKIFPKRLTHGFGQKTAIFPCLSFFCNIRQENVIYNIPEQKTAFLAYKNNTFKKWKNWDFSKGVNPWFWSKNGHFSMSSRFGNIGQENVIYNIPEQKNAFLAPKKTKLKKSKN